MAKAPLLVEVGIFVFQINGLSLPQSVFDRPWFVARPIERQRHSTPTEARTSTDSLSYPCELVSAVHGRTCAKSPLAFLSARRSCGFFSAKNIANYRSSRSFHDVLAAPSSLKETVIW